MKTLPYYYCETAAAVSRKWHLRHKDGAPKLGGGVHAKTLCGLDAAWDIRRPVLEGQHEVLACLSCRLVAVPDLREAQLADLKWTHLPLDLLTDQQLDALSRYQNACLRERGSCSVPGVHQVVRERRLGPTNRMGWRWVVYVGRSIDTAVEVARGRTRGYANDLAKMYHALYFADFAARFLSNADRCGEA